MKALKVFFFLVIFVLFSASLIFSADSKVRVTTHQANVRLRPDIQSEVLAKIPLGAMLDIVKRQGEWYFVKLPPDEKGILVTGYIHKSVVEPLEIEEEIKQPEKIVPEPTPKLQEEKIAEEVSKKPLISNLGPYTKSEIKGRPLSEKEKYFMATDSYYSSWREKLDQAKRSQSGAKKWMWIGGGTMLVGYAVVPLLAVSSLNERSTGESQDKMVTIGVIAGTVGGVLLTYGLISYVIKGKKVGNIMEEGMIKGYILGMKIDPRNKEYGITLAYRF